MGCASRIEFEGSQNGAADGEVRLVEGGEQYVDRALGGDGAENARHLAADRDRCVGIQQHIGEGADYAVSESCQGFDAVGPEAGESQHVEQSVEIHAVLQPASGPGRDFGYLMFGILKQSHEGPGVGVAMDRDGSGRQHTAMSVGRCGTLFDPLAGDDAGRDFRVVDERLNSGTGDGLVGVTEEALRESGTVFHVFEGVLDGRLNRLIGVAGAEERISPRAASTRPGNLYSRASE